MEFRIQWVRMPIALRSPRRSRAGLGRRQLQPVHRLPEGERNRMGRISGETTRVQTGLLLLTFGLVRPSGPVFDP